MKANYKVTLALLIGALTGVAGTEVIHAKQTKPLPAYVIAEEQVTDAALFQKYADQVPATLAPFNGHYVIRGGKTTAVEGTPPGRTVVLSFESTEKALAWENSPAYEAIKPIRHQASTSRVFIIEGLAP